MVRVLIATLPVPGHVAPMAEVARKLVERGNEVVWYGSKFFEARIAATGARFVPIASTLDYGDSQYNRYFPERAKLKGLAQIKFDFKHLFVDATEGYVKDLRGILADYPAEVLLADPAVAAARILGEQTGMAWAHLNISVLGLPSRDVPPFGLGLWPSSSTFGRLRNQALYWLAGNVLFRDVQKHYDATADRNGWPHFPFRPTASPFLYLQPSIPEFEYPRSDLPAQVHFIGPLLPRAPVDFTPPAWWGDLTSTNKPVVLVTQGTIATDREQLIVPALRALAGEDVFVVVTAGGKTAAELKLDVPANAHVVPFIPFTHLMPHVSAMITNGGYGGVMIALAHGVPIVSAGTSEDKPEVGNRIAYAGVGINLKTATPTSAQIKEAVTKVLTEASYRTRAQQLKGELARYDAPTTAAQLVEKLAWARSPVYATWPTERPARAEMAWKK